MDYNGGIMVYTGGINGTHIFRTPMCFDAFGFLPFRWWGVCVRSPSASAASSSSSSSSSSTSPVPWVDLRKHNPHPPSPLVLNLRSWTNPHLGLVNRATSCTTVPFSQAVIFSQSERDSAKRSMAAMQASASPGGAPHSTA